MLGDHYRIIVDISSWFIGKEVRVKGRVPLIRSL